MYDSTLPQYTAFKNGKLHKCDILGRLKIPTFLLKICFVCSSLDKNLPILSPRSTVLSTCMIWVVTNYQMLFYQAANLDSSKA